jgi:hypothetical protein
MDIISVIEKVGLAIATILGLVYVLRWLSQAHLLALNSRITTLESVVAKRDNQIEAAQLQINMQANQHAHEMKDIAVRLATEIKENRAFNREQHAVLVRLLDKLDSRPCMIAEYHPHPTPKPATHQDLPQPPTDRLQTHG